MKSFEMALPRSVDEAVRLLPAKIGDDRARLLAGGQDLLTELKEHLVEPETLVNLKSIPGLRGVREEGDLLRIGALTTLADLEAFAAAGSLEGCEGGLAMLLQTLESIASPQIRSQATVGGNLNQRPRCWYYRMEQFPCLKKGGTECFSYYGKNRYNAILGGGPSYIVHPSDLAPAFIALDAEIELVGPNGTRRMALEDFFVLPSEGDPLRETRIAANEVLTAVLLPRASMARRSVYLKFKERDAYDFALAAVALSVEFAGDGTFADVRLVLGGVAPTPWRCHRTEKKLLGREPGEDATVLAQEDALAEAQPLSENGYKIPLTKGLLAQALLRVQEVR
jgi:xanthine dehydrogenase YagS FAD-binding subunit